MSVGTSCEEFDFPLLRYCIQHDLKSLAWVLTQAMMVTIEDLGDSEEAVLSFTNEGRDAYQTLARAPMIRDLRVAIKSVTGKEMGIRLMI